MACDGMVPPAGEEEGGSPAAGGCGPPAEG